MLSVVSLAIWHEAGTLRNIAVGSAIATRCIGIASRIVRKIKIKRNKIEDNTNENIAMNAIGFASLGCLLTTLALKTNDIGMKIALSIGIMVKIGLTSMFLIKTAKLMKKDLTLQSDQV